MTLYSALTHLFLPHDSNNHKSRLLHPHAFLTYIVFIVFFGFGIRAISYVAPQILGIATNISVEELLQSTNQQRQKAGLSVLILNPRLSKAAEEKANNMFQNNYWAHFGPDGESPWDFIISSGYTYSYAGENLAKDFNDSVSVVDAWMASPTHKDNILKSEYNDIGFAVVNGMLNGQETTLVVQMFGSSTTAELTTEANTPFVEEVASITSFNDTSQAPKEPVQQELIIAGVRQLPVLDIKTLNKSVTLLLLGLVVLVLILDGILIWKRKTIRISGHNISHVLFLVAFISLVWLTTTGAIR